MFPQLSLTKGVPGDPGGFPVPPSLVMTQFKEKRRHKIIFSSISPVHFRPDFSLLPTFSGHFSLLCTDWRGKKRFIVGLPRCNMNSKVQILGKSEVLTVKSRSETLCGNPPIRENLVITRPYTERASDLPSAPQVYQCKITQSTGMTAQMQLKVLLERKSQGSLCTDVPPPSEKVDFF